MARKENKASVSISSKLPLEIQRALRSMQDTIAQLQAQIEAQGKELSGKLGGGKPDLAAISTAVRTDLQANGSNPLSVASLPGITAQPQKAMVPAYTIPPVPTLSVGSLISQNGQLFRSDGKVYVPVITGSILTGTHSMRLSNYPASKYTTGTLFYETDRNVLYYTAVSGGWTYLAGMQTSVYASLPGDLGSSDKNYLFYATDKQATYEWSGSSFFTQLALSGSSTTVPALLTPADWAAFHTGATTPGPTGPTGPAGTNGTNGTNGAAGAAATIAVGSTTTGAAGTSAAVTNSGTSSAATFNFTIPQGVAGTTGATGPAGPAPSGSANQVVATPNGSSGTSSLRALVAADIPALSYDALGAASAAQTAAQTYASNANNLTSGTVAAARLPNPTATTLGGIESLAAATSKWLNSISTAGVPSATQPAFSDISGSIATGQVPTLNQSTTGTAANVTGTVALANGGTGQTTAAAAITALTGTQTAGRYLRSDGTNATLAALQAADVPTLNQSTTGTAGNVTGTVAIANGGTGQVTAAAGLTALGGASLTGTNNFTSTANGFGNVPSPQAAVNVAAGQTVQIGANTDPFFTIFTTNQLRFNRAASTSYLDQSGLGGSLAVRLSVSSPGDKTAMTFTAAAATVAIPLYASAGFAAAVRFVSTATDTATVTDRSLMLSGVTTETLPASPPIGQEIIVVNTSAANVTIAGNGHNIINAAGTSATTITLGNLAVMILMYDGVSNNVWRQIK